MGQVNKFGILDLRFGIESFMLKGGGTVDLRFLMAGKS
jgi:hypothetical protein